MPKLSCVARSKLRLASRTRGSTRSALSAAFLLLSESLSHEFEGLEATHAQLRD